MGDFGGRHQGGGFSQEDLDRHLAFADEEDRSFDPRHIQNVQAQHNDRVPPVPPPKPGKKGRASSSARNRRESHFEGSNRTPVQAVSAKHELTVEIIDAVNLASAVNQKTLDAYINLSFEGANHRSTIKNNMTDSTIVWREKFTFQVPDVRKRRSRSTSKKKINVPGEDDDFEGDANDYSAVWDDDIEPRFLKVVGMDKDKFTKDDLVGQSRIPIWVGQSPVFQTEFWYTFRKDTRSESMDEGHPSAQSGLPQVRLKLAYLNEKLILAEEFLLFWQWRRGFVAFRELINTKKKPSFAAKLCMLCGVDNAPKYDDEIQALPPIDMMQEEQEIHRANAPSNWEENFDGFGDVEMQPPQTPRDVKKEKKRKEKEERERRKLSHNQEALQPLMSDHHMPAGGKANPKLIQFERDYNHNSKSNRRWVQACRGGDVLIIRNLIEQRNEGLLNRLRVDPHGRSPLFIAAAYGHVQAVKLLRVAGCDVNCRKDTGETPLFAACENGHDRVVAILCGFKANTELCRVTDNATPLFAAAAGGHVRAVEILLEYNASTELPDVLGRTPLLMACMEGSEKVARALIEHGADPDGAPHMVSPLVAAIKRNHTNVVKVLVRNGAELLADELRSLITEASGDDEALCYLLHNKISKEPWDYPKIHVFEDLVDRGSAELMDSYLSGMYVTQYEGFSFQFPYRDALTAKGSFELRLQPEAVERMFRIRDDSFHKSHQRLAACVAVGLDFPGFAGHDPNLPIDSAPIMMIEAAGRHELYSVPAIKALVDFKWHAFGKAGFYKEVFLYFAMLVAFSVVTIHHGHDDLSTPVSNRFTNMLDPWNYVVLPLMILVLLLVVILLLLEAKQLITERRGCRYLRNYRNYYDISVLCLILAYYFLFFTDNVYQFVVSALALVMAWTKLIFVATRGFERLAVFVRTVHVAVTVEALPLLQVFLCILLAFSGALFIILQADSTSSYSSFFSTVCSVFGLSFGVFDLDVLTDSPTPNLAHALVIVFIFLASLVLCNFLVAVFTDGFSRAQARALDGWNQDRARYVVETELSISRNSRGYALKFPRFLHFTLPVAPHRVNYVSSGHTYYEAKSKIKEEVQRYTRIEERLTSLEDHLRAVDETLETNLHAIKYLLHPPAPHAVKVRKGGAGEPMKSNINNYPKDALRSDPITQLASPTTGLDGPRIDGYLYKVSKYAKKLYQRYFAVVDGYFFYFRNYDDFKNSVPKMQLNTMEIEAVEGSSETKVSRTLYKFVVIHSSKTFYLYALTAEERNKWVKAIKESCEWEKKHSYWQTEVKALDIQLQMDEVDRYERSQKHAAKNTPKGQEKLLEKQFSKMDRDTRRQQDGDESDRNTGHALGYDQRAAPGTKNKKQNKKQGKANRGSNSHSATGDDDMLGSGVGGAPAGNRTLTHHVDDEPSSFQPITRRY